MTTIQCNGESRQVAAGTSVTGLITALGMEPDHVVVEHNGRILARPDYDTQQLADGDRVEIMRFVGGG